MKSYQDWREHAQEKEDVKKDAHGGVIPGDLKRAKKVDLITLPPKIEGTHCFNCKWVMNKKGKVRYCDHPEVHDFVNERMCCREWDHPGVKRPWK